jgi:tRNA A37 N6-isopentenylltransferase MiaA
VKNKTAIIHAKAERRERSNIHRILVQIMKWSLILSTNKMSDRHEMQINNVRNRMQNPISDYNKRQHD